MMLYLIHLFCRFWYKNKRQILCIIEIMKVYFNGWPTKFFDKTDPCIHIGFFMDLFKCVYNEDCEIGTLDNSEILCEFDALDNCPCTFIWHKIWKHTYLVSGESFMKCNTNEYDVVLWIETNRENVVNMPLFVPYLYCNNFITRITQAKNITNVPKNDVCAIITNPNGTMRNAFLNKLEKYFNVTYAGKYKNNIGGNIDYMFNTDEYLDIIGSFKFIVSMENSKNDTYITEKLVNGMLANIIPVYWGTTSVFDYFNKDRFLNVVNEEDIDNVINKMIEISRDDNMWLKMVNQDNLLNNKLELTIEKIAEDIKCVLECSNK